MGIQIRDYGPPEPPEGEEHLTREQMQERYKVLGFAYGFCIVERKSDGVKGTLSFTHMPRFYFNFQPEPPT